MADKNCSVDGCTYSTDRLRRGMCERHYRRFLTYGDTERRWKGQLIRSAIVDGEVARIPLNKGLEAVVAIADLPKVEGFNWRVVWNGYTHYAVRTELGKSILMHREIMEAPSGVEVDHVDRDGLNNRRDNLRLATRSQNCVNRGLAKNNTSGFVGIVWHKQSSKWNARIKVDGVRRSLGYYHTKEEASAAYKSARRVLFGEFAPD